MLWIFKIRFWNKVMLKNKPACQFSAHFSVQNGKQLLNEIRYQKSQQGIGEKTTERKCANFQDQGISRSKLKGKVNCENEHREMASFMYNFVQKTNATKQLVGGILYQLRHWIFSHGFHRKIRSERNFKKRPKSDLRQKVQFFKILLSECEGQLWAF